MKQLQEWDDAWENSFEGGLKEKTAPKTSKRGSPGCCMRCSCHKEPARSKVLARGPVSSAGQILGAPIATVHGATRKRRVPCSCCKGIHCGRCEILVRERRGRFGPVLRPLPGQGRRSFHRLLYAKARL